MNTELIYCRNTEKWRTSSTRNMKRAHTNDFLFYFLRYIYMELFSGQKHGTSNISRTFGVRSDVESQPTTLASCVNSTCCSTSQSLNGLEIRSNTTCGSYSG